VTKLLINIDGEKIETELNSAACPYTINAFLRKRIINSLVINVPYGFLINTGVIAGYEKARDHFKQGDLAFDPRGSWLIIFKIDSIYHSRANPIGSVLPIDIEKFMGIRSVVLEFKLD
jgi:hypothetical protein